MSSNLRGHTPKQSFSDSARAARAGAGSGGYKQVNGKYDRLKLGDNPIWIRFSPDQLYAQVLWNRELKALITTGTPEHPARQWYETVSHFNKASNRPFNCSSGPARDKPCRGCAVRQSFYDLQDAKREADKAAGIEEPESTTGEKRKRPEPPVQVSSKYVMSATVLEKILELPKMKGGQPQTIKGSDKVVTEFIPGPLSGLNPVKLQGTSGEIGRNYHFGVGPQHLSQLASIDETLWNYCASCANALQAEVFSCVECGAEVFTSDSPLQGEDLGSLRREVFRCGHCQHEGRAVPLVSCTHCDNPIEGDNFAFDLRLKSVKDLEDDKKSTITLVGFRVPDYEKVHGPEVGARLWELVMSPLDIPAIYAPDSVDSQKWALPPALQAVDPSYHLKKKEAVAYGSSAAEGKESAGIDPDQMHFDDNED